MRRSRITAFRPRLERFEEKQLLSSLAPGAHHAAADKGAPAALVHPLPTEGTRGLRPNGQPSPPSAPNHFLIYRVTQPTYRIVHLVPPFQQVKVEHAQPVPGRVYNVLFVVVLNGTGQTFTAANNFKVRLPGFTGTHRVVDSAFPVLTGNQVWKPKTWIVFYVLSKKYYPLSPQVAAGFQLDTGGRSSTLVPGPSGIFLRLTYDPAKFAKQLDWIVAYGQGAELGPGAAAAMPDTTINELVAARTQRFDFAGHF